MVSPNLKALVAAGRPGLYDWRPDGSPYVSDETAALLTVGDRPSTAEQVRERVLTAVTEEIGSMLAENVVAAPMDVDLCLVLGAGLAVPPGRHHAVPGPRGLVRAGRSGGGSCRPGVASVPAGRA